MALNTSKQAAATRSAAGAGAASGEQPSQPRQVETVIIGSGFSGLLAAIRLQKKRFDDFILLE